MPKLQPDSRKIFISGILLALLAFIGTCKQNVDLDLWWHLAAGRWIAEHRAFIYADPFSFTAHGQRWVSMTWLYELLCWFLYQLSDSIRLITLFHACLAALTFFCCWRVFLLLKPAARSSTLIGFAAFIAALSVAEFRWINRPEMVTQALGAVFLLVLTREWLSTDARPLPRGGRIALIAGLQIVWVNCHGLFVFGPALCGLFALCSFIEGRDHPRFRRLAMLTALSIAACAINPYGLTGMTWPLHLLSVLRDPIYRTTIPEATNPFLDHAWKPDAWGLLLWGLFGLIAAAWGIRRAKKREKPDLAWLILLPVLFYLSVEGRRNTSLFILWTLPWFAAAASDLLGGLLGRSKLPDAISWLPEPAIALLTAAVLISNGLRLSASDVRFGWDSYPHRFSDGAADYLRGLQSQGHEQRFFATVEASDYLLFEIPGFRSYIDGRFAELYSVDLFRRYLQVLSQPSFLDAEAKRLNLDGAILSLHPAAARGVVYYLSTRPDWKLTYLDEDFVIFLRQNPPPNAHAGADLSAFPSQHDRAAENLIDETPDFLSSLDLHQRADAARPWIQLAQLSSLLGSSEFARRDLEHAVSIDPKNPQAAVDFCVQGYLEIEKLIQSATRETAAATADRVQARIDGTINACQSAYVTAGPQPILDQVVGMLDLNLGKPADAIPHFQKMVKADPKNSENFLMLGRALAMLGDRSRIGEMREAYRKAAALMPSDPAPIRELSEMEAKLRQ